MIYTSHQHFPQYVCSAQYGCFLQLLDFLIFRYVEQVFCKWFWDGYCCFYYYRHCTSEGQLKLLSSTSIKRYVRPAILLLNIPALISIWQYVAV